MDRTAALHLPAVYQWPEMANEGGLIAYGPRLIEMFRQMGRRQLIKLFRGVKPADLPVEQPTLFDLVINLFSSFGYYQSAADNFEALRQMASALKPGGMLVMEILPCETLDGIFNEKRWQATRGGYLHQKRSWADGGHKLHNDIVWIGKGREREASSEIFVYTKDELAAMFRRAGLKKVKTYKNYQGAAFKTGERLVIAGVK
jgi:SAM-dependent methyltransferase